MSGRQPGVGPVQQNRESEDAPRNGPAGGDFLYGPILPLRALRFPAHTGMVGAESKTRRVQK